MIAVTSLLFYHWAPNIIWLELSLGLNFLYISHIIWNMKNFLAMMAWTLGAFFVVYVSGTSLGWVVFTFCMFVLMDVVAKGLTTNPRR